VNQEHSFTVSVEWAGNRGSGTSGYRDYGREVVARSDGKATELQSSAARVFHGDAERWNPEELLIASLSECHLLSYLYVAVREGIVVERYTDDASGVLELTGDGGGRFTQVTLRPVVSISAGDPALAARLHREASEKCFIAASVNFPVRHEPTILVLDDLRS
jgi:organic hydroperoxide reductase OsmC/OhrA